MTTKQARMREKILSSVHYYYYYYHLLSTYWVFQTSYNNKHLVWIMCEKLTQQPHILFSSLNIKWVLNHPSIHLESETPRKDIHNRDLRSSAHVRIIFTPIYYTLLDRYRTLAEKEKYALRVYILSVCSCVWFCNTGWANISLLLPPLYNNNYGESHLETNVYFRFFCMLTFFEGSNIFSWDSCNNIFFFSEKKIFCFSRKNSPLNPLAAKECKDYKLSRPGNLTFL